MPNHDQRARILQREINTMRTQQEQANSDRGRLDRELEKAESGSQKRDRNWFLVSLLNGDRSVYEKIRSLRAEYEEKTKRVGSLERQLASAEKEVHSVLDEKLTAEDPEYQRLEQQRAAARRVADLCRNARTLASRLSNTIDAAGRDKDTDLSTVSSQTKLLWQAVGAVNKHAHGYGHVSGLDNLKTSVSGQRDLPLLGRVVRQLQVDVGAILEKAAVDARAFQAARDQRLESEREQLAREVPG